MNLHLRPLCPAKPNHTRIASRVCLAVGCAAFVFALAACQNPVSEGSSPGIPTVAPLAITAAGTGLAWTVSIYISTSGATIDDATFNYGTNQTTSSATYSGPFRENLSALNKGVLIWAVGSKSGSAGTALASKTIGVTSPLSLSGAVTTLAGSGTYGSGNGTAATFYYPAGITTDGTNLYVTEYNNNDIRKIVIASPYTVTILGGSTTGGSADGTGTAAQFRLPSGITTDGTNLYVADTYNNEIRMIK